MLECTSLSAGKPTQLGKQARKVRNQSWQPMHTLRKVIVEQSSRDRHYGLAIQQRNEVTV